MFGYLGFDRLQMERVLGAEFGLTAAPLAGLQALDAFRLIAPQPVVDDYLTATQNIGDLKRGALLALEENHLTAGAEGVACAFTIAFFQSGALLKIQFNDFVLPIRADSLTYFCWGAYLEFYKYPDLYLKLFR